MDILMVVALLALGAIGGYLAASKMDETLIDLYTDQLVAVEDSLDEYAAELDRVEDLNERLVSSNVIIFNVAAPEHAIEFSQERLEFEDGDTIVRAEG